MQRIWIKCWVVKYASQVIPNFRKIAFNIVTWFLRNLIKFYCPYFLHPCYNMTFLKASFHTKSTKWSCFPRQIGLKVSQKLIIHNYVHLQQATPSDSGNYTCAPANYRQHSVIVNVIKGEQQSQQFSFNRDDTWMLEGKWYHHQTV